MIKSLPVKPAVMILFSLLNIYDDMAIKHEKLAQFFHYHTIGFHLFPTHQNHLEVLKTEEKKDQCPENELRDSDQMNLG